MHHASSMTPPPSAASTNTTKAFMRLNTECKQRSMDRPRPLLSKAQSMAVSYCNSAAAALVNNNNNSQHHQETNNHHSPQADNGNNGDLRDENGRWSRSSSTNSLEKLASQLQQQECVTSLTFINCYSKKGCKHFQGACIAFNLILPFDRLISNVVVAPSDMYDGPQGSIVRLQERVLYSTFLDKDFCIISGATETFKDVTKDSAPASANMEKACKTRWPPFFKPLPSSTNRKEELVANPEELSQLGVFVSEQEIRVLSLPGYHQHFHYRADIPFIKAKSSHIRGYPVLICLNAAGQLQVMSLPSLKQLYQTPLFRCSVDLDDPICQRLISPSMDLACTWFRLQKCKSSL
uniref:Uncharacterized protein n=1 Tax=Ditylenchus dipsaci TaxID=166011 RepID=A0A915DDC3_9BILA